MGAKRRSWMAWGIRWESKNHVDGASCYLIGSYGVSPIPELAGCTGALMFQTKRECVEYIHKRFGYIRVRKDLRNEPHGWRMPKAVRINVTIQDTP